MFLSNAIDTTPKNSAGGAAEPFPLSRASPWTWQPAPPDTTPSRIPGRRRGTSELHQVNQVLPTNRRGAAADRARGRALPAAACSGRPPAALRARSARPAVAHPLYNILRDPPCPRPRRPAPPGKTVSPFPPAAAPAGPGHKISPGSTAGSLDNKTPPSFRPRSRAETGQDTLPPFTARLWPRLHANPVTISLPIPGTPPVNSFERRKPVRAPHP